MGKGEHLVMGGRAFGDGEGRAFGDGEGEHYQHDENTVGDGAIVEMVL